jgi:hypothetical protein
MEKLVLSPLTELQNLHRAKVSCMPFFRVELALGQPGRLPLLGMRICAPQDVVPAQELVQMHRIKG